MEYCPADVLSGFATLKGPISSTDLLKIAVKKAPLYVSFAPRTTPASISGNRIIEGAQSTCLYNNSTYTLVDIQICAPLHTGYKLPDMTDDPVAELILTFSGKNISGILLCVPIYNTGTADTYEYINQIIDRETDAAKIKSLESIFVKENKQSIAYRTCFEIQDKSNAVYHHDLYVLVFPKGIYLEPRYYTQLTATIGSLKNFAIPPAIRDGNPTVNQKQPLTTSVDGNIYKIEIPITDLRFKNLFEYFTSSPALVKSGTNAVSKTTFYSTSQYKCVPLDIMKDIDNKGVVTPYEGNTLTRVLTEKTQQLNAANNQETNKIFGLDVLELEIYIGIGLASILVITIFGSSYYYYKNNSD